MLSTLGPVKQGAAGQAEAADEFGNGEATAFFLVGGLRESLLIGLGIRHRDAGAIDDFDMAPAPELLALNPALRLIGGVPMNVEQGVIGQAGSGIAIGGGAGTGSGLTAGDIPGLDLSDGLTAGAVGGEHLGEEGPEGDALREKALAAVCAPVGGFEKPCRHPRSAELAELAQGGLFEGLPLGLELMAGRALGAAEELEVESGEKRGCISHI